MKQAWRDSNPQPPDLESGALAKLCYRPEPHQPLWKWLMISDIALLLPGFLVYRMLVAEPAVFFELHATRMLPFVFGRVVVPLLALGTFQYDFIAHDPLSS